VPFPVVDLVSRLIADTTPGVDDIATQPLLKRHQPVAAQKKPKEDEDARVTMTLQALADAAKARKAITGAKGMSLDKNDDICPIDSISKVFVVRELYTLKKSL